jgi:hypothetical protein
MSESIFNLKTNVNELSSSNQGTSRMEYEQHPPTRDVVNDNFANGAIHFRFQTSGQKWWIPARSYIRTRFRITKGDGTTPLDIGDEIAPNMGLMSNLFQSGEMRINDKVVSRVADFMPQVDSLETRLTKSKSWLESVGEATNLWETEQSKRMQNYSSDGIDAPSTETKTRVQLGYDAATNTVAVAVDTGILTFADGGGDALPTLADVWNVGDEIEIDAAGVIGTVRYIVSALTGAQTIQLNNLKGIAIPATANAFRRIRSTVNTSKRLEYFETIWCPPLSLFKVEHALPGGRYELVLNPQTATSFQQRAIESILGTASKNPTLPGGNDADYKVNVENMYMYTATVEGPRMDNVTYLLDLEQTRCQSEKVDNTNFQQKNFDVSPSTYALTVAYQDLRCGNNTALSASKFKSYDGAGIPTTSEELKLNRFFINYAGQNLPAPDADPSFVAGTDYTIQRYSESQIYSGAYFDTGGAETIEEFHDRGAYYYFSWPRDGTDRSTRVNVHQQFNAADVNNLRCLLFDHSKQVARIKVENGHVVQVDVEDA